MKFNFSSVSLKKDLASFFVYNAMTACSKENQEIIPNWLLNKGIKEPQCHRGFGPPPRPNPLADMDPPSQIWTPYQPFKHRLYHIW